MSDYLVLIPLDELPELRDLYKVNWPQHRLIYQTIDNFCFWLKINPSLDDLSVFSLNGSWRENGTAIIKNHLDIHLATLDETLESLYRALCLLDWSPGLQVYAFLENIRPAVLRAIAKCKVPIDSDITYKLFELDKEKAKHLENIIFHDGIRIERLTIKDAAVANDMWSYKNDKSLRFLQRLAEYNNCYGARSSTGQLIGWIFTDCSRGTINLHVLEGFRGRKIAQALIVKSCLYISATFNHNPHALVLETNFPSIRLSQKLGYAENPQLGYWIQTKPFESVANETSK